MPDYTPQSLHQILAATVQDADAFRARCEQAVVRWRRATGKMLQVHPLDDQVDRGLEYVHGWRVAKEKWLPDDADGRQLGLDSQGRVRVSGGDYIDYTPEWIDELDSRGGLTRYLRDAAGHVVDAWEIEDTSCVHEYFEWRDGRVVRSLVTTWLFEDGHWDDGQFIRAYDYEYAADGSLERVTRKSTTGGRPIRAETVFSRPKRGVSLKKAFKTVEDFLVEHIPLAVAEHGQKGKDPPSPLYALLLTYCGEDITSGWPQRIYLLTEAHCQRILAEYPDEVFYRLWFTNELADGVFDISPCEAAAAEELGKHALQALELANQREDFDYDELRQVLCRVALRLNKLDWSSIVPVTDDFIVSAVDDHGETNPFDDWKASVPAKKLKRLQAQGLLPRPEDLPGGDAGENAEK